MENNILIENLKSNPIFAMMHSSIENAHSDVFKNLMEKDSNFIKFFFPEIDNLNNCKIEREQNHRDISIWIDKDCYVIENKFKSIPHSDQLEEYESKLKKSFKRGILLGFEKPIWIDNFKNWSFISYFDILKEIKNIIDSNIINDIDKVIYAKYYEVLYSELELFNNFNSSNKNILSKTKDRMYLDEIKLSDIFGKINFEYFCDYLRNSKEMKNIIDEFSKIENVKFRIYSDFYRKLPISNIQINIGNLTFGIMIQDDCYGRVVVSNGDLCKKFDSSKLFEIFKNIGWMVEKTIHGNQKARFNKFEVENKYRCIWSPFVLEKMDFEFIKNKIISDLKILLNIIKNNDISKIVNS